MKKITLTKNKIAYIDNEDYEIISKYKWYAHQSRKNNFYAATTIKGKIFYMHRMIISAPKKTFVDHKNQNKLDNRRKNLRFCTNSENNRNKNISKKNTSGHKGVYWSKHAKKWHVQISTDNKILFLGRFKNIEKASNIYNKKAKELSGDFAVLNKTKNK